MTDNDIIKALECCGIKGQYICEEDCPMYNNGIKSISICRRELKLSALDLINRQKAEIERLQEVNNSFTDIGKLYSEIKAEAIKEFAERLKEKQYCLCDDVVDVEDIDNLVKEMVGDV